MILRIHFKMLKKAEKLLQRLFHLHSTGVHGTVTTYVVTIKHQEQKPSFPLAKWVIPSAADILYISPHYTPKIYSSPSENIAGKREEDFCSLFVAIIGRKAMSLISHFPTKYACMGLSPQVKIQNNRHSSDTAAQAGIGRQMQISAWRRWKPSGPNHLQKKDKNHQAFVALTGQLERQASSACLALSCSQLGGQAIAWGGWRIFLSFSLGRVLICLKLIINERKQCHPATFVVSGVMLDRCIQYQMPE